MFSKEKTKTIFLRLAGVSLGLLLAAVGGTFAPRPSPLVPAAGIALAASPTPDGTCPAVRHAFENLFTTPYHMYSTTSLAGGRAISGETIFAGGALYVLFNGKWQTDSSTLEELKAKEQENFKNAKNSSCHVVREESVNGEIATLYSVHEETVRSRNDSQIWISKSSGHVLRSETDMYSNQGNRKTHVSARYDYNNVQAPKL